MNKIKHKLLLLPLTFLFASQAFAQDPEFTQFFASPIYTNPAFAGTASGGRIVANYRMQWPSLPGTFVTLATAYDQHFDAVGGGIGIIVTSDRAGQGILKTTTISGIYSYELRVNRKLTFKAGIQASFYQKSIDFDKLTFSDMIEPRSGFKFPTSEPLPRDNKSFANFSTGILAYTKNFYAGFAIHNLTQPNQSFYNSAALGNELPRRYTFHSGMIIPLGGNKNKPLSEQNTICPNILFMVQKEFNQVNLGFYINKGPLVSGLWFRQTSENGDALMVLIGFRQKSFRFAYSYDLTVSDARAAATGSHELSTSIEWKPRQRPKGPKKINCPDFY